MREIVRSLEGMRVCRWITDAERNSDTLTRVVGRARRGSGEQRCSRLIHVLTNREERVEGPLAALPGGQKGAAPSTTTSAVPVTASGVSAAGAARETIRLRTAQSLVQTPHPLLVPQVEFLSFGLRSASRSSPLPVTVESVSLMRPASIAVPLCPVIVESRRVTAPTSPCPRDAHERRVAELHALTYAAKRSYPDAVTPSSVTTPGRRCRRARRSS